MAAVLTSFLRGMVGVAASVLVVAVVWTAYIHRAGVTAALGPVTSLFARGDPAPDAAPANPPAPAPVQPAKDATAAPGGGAEGRAPSTTAEQPPAGTAAPAQ